MRTHIVFKHLFIIVPATSGRLFQKYISHFTFRVIVQDKEDAQIHEASLVLLEA